MNRHVIPPRRFAAALSTAILLLLLAARPAKAAEFDTLPAAQRTDIHRRTDQQFFARHPELQGRSLRPDSDPALKREYMALRSQVMAQVTSSQKRAPSSPAGSGSGYEPSQWYGDVPPHSGPSDAASGSSVGSGRSSKGTLEARSTAMAQEARRLADEYSTASPQRMEQIRGRLQQMYQDALALQKDYLALGAVAAGGRATANGAVGPSGTAAAVTGTVSATGQLMPASSLAVSPREFFQQLAAERVQKAAVRDRQADIFDAGALDQQAHLDEGRTAFDLATGRAGIDMVNGVSRTAMAVAAPDPLYYSYEGLNAGASLSKDTGFSLFDTDLNLNNPFGNEPRTEKPFDRPSAANSIRIAKDAKSIFSNSEKAANSLPPVFVLDDEPNVFNNFGHAPETDPGPSRLSQSIKKIGKGLEVMDGAANSAKLGNNLVNGQYFDATKNAVDLGGNAASVFESKTGGRAASGAKGVLAFGEGMRNAGNALDEKNRFSQSVQVNVDLFSTRAEERRRQAARERELNLWFLQISTREPAIAPGAVPPAQGPNRDHFTTE